MKNILIGIIIVAAIGAVLLFMNKPAGAEINSFDECIQAGYTLIKTKPPQCQTPNGMVFVQTNSATIEPVDPAKDGLAQYPDEPLDSVPVESVSPRYVIEHRSALDGKEVDVSGKVVSALIGDDACPPDRGACAQSRIQVAESEDEGRDKMYDLVIFVAQNADYAVGERVEIIGTVTGSKTAVSLRDRRIF